MTATPVWKRGKAVRHWCRYCGCILKITNTSGVLASERDALEEALRSLYFNPGPPALQC